MKVFNTILLTVVICASATAQDPKEILSDLIENNGAWEDVRTLRFSTKRLNHNKWQNYSFTKPIPNNDEAFAEYDFVNLNYYTKTIGRYGGGNEFIFATVGKDTTRYFYDVNQSRNGKQMLKGGKAVFDNSFGFVNNFIPYFALKTVHDSEDSLVITDSKDETVMSRYLKNGQKIDYYFGEDEYLKKISRLQGGRQIDQLFLNYTRHKGFAYPGQIKTYLDNELITEDRIDSIEINKPTNYKLLEIPKDYVVAQPAKPMRTTEISKGVFLIEGVGGDRNVMFVNMDKHVFVTDAPLNSDITKSVADEIRKTVPNKPIKYVHLSHFHSDHVEGVRTYVAEGATVLTTEPTVAPIKTILEDKTGRFKDELAKNNKPGVFETFSNVKVLKDGNHEIQLHEIKNNHAEGMSFVYLPKEQIIYQSDLLTIPEDGTITPAIEITRDLDKYIKEKKLAVKRIIGHHGLSAITTEMLSKMMTMEKRDESGGKSSKL